MDMVSLTTRDRISELPDDILLSIIPAELKQAAETSILSKRWRYLWAKRSHLHFHHLVVLPELHPDPDAEQNYYLIAGEQSKYINWVNQVVDVHCGPCIDTFKVWFHFDKSHAHHIDKWLRFSLLKKVKHLELKLISNNAVYTFESDILKPLPSPSVSDVSLLTTLHFTNINVSGDVLELLLSRCPLLERLAITRSWTLVRWKVIGLSCNLKQLVINRCPKLEELEIDAANLTYFECDCGHDLSNLMFKSVPVLHEVKVVRWSPSDSLLPPIFGLAGQIYKFYLGQAHMEISGGPVPTFSNLKQLTLQISSYGEIDLFALTNLLEACPVLCEFKLEISWRGGYGEGIVDEAIELTKPEGGDNIEVENVIDGEDQDNSDVGNVLHLDDQVNAEAVEYFDRIGVLQQKSYPNLKVLHVAGFNGQDADVDLILYFVNVASNLDTIICDSSRCHFESPEPGQIEASRSRASKLIKIVPPKICVEVI